MSKIEWTKRTWNPIVGCTKVSPGCLHCYAERMACRQVAMGKARHEAGSTNDDTWAAYSSVIDPETGKWNGGVAYRDSRVPRADLVFVCSMSDLFGPAVPDAWIDRVYDAMLSCDNTVFQILTKHPDRAVAWLDDNPRYSPPDGWRHIWWGTTVESAEFLPRIDQLLTIPAPVRFMSIEPMLGPILLPDRICRLSYDEPEIPCVDWVIIGCESGPGRRPCQRQWVIDLVEQCHAARAPVFVKQIEIAGKVSRDAGKIAAELGYGVEQIRQMPKGQVTP